MTRCVKFLSFMNIYTLSDDAPLSPFYAFISNFLNPFMHLHLEYFCCFKMQQTFLQKNISNSDTLRNNVL